MNLPKKLVRKLPLKLTRPKKDSPIKVNHTYKTSIYWEKEDTTVKDEVKGEKISNIFALRTSPKRLIIDHLPSGCRVTSVPLGKDARKNALAVIKMIELKVKEEHLKITDQRKCALCFPHRMRLWLSKLNTLDSYEPFSKG